MAGRPEALFPLFAEITELKGIGPKSAKALESLGITAPRDLLFTLPHNLIDRRPVDTVQGAPLPGYVTVRARIGTHRPPRRPGRPYRIDAEDSGTTFQIVFFRGGSGSDYISRLLPQGADKIVSGKAEIFDGVVQIVHPDLVLDPGEADDIARFEPVYPLASGLTQKQMQHAVADALARAPAFPEWTDAALVAREDWPTTNAALARAHAPETVAHLAAQDPARTRLAYDELLAHQLTLALARASLRKSPGRATEGDGQLRERIIAALPYQMTGAQRHAVSEIAADMASDQRMNRLLQGDVGAGKTLVAMLAMAIAVEAGGQAAMMAPTEILARQHLDSLRPLAESAGLVTEILTGRDKGAERAAKLAALAAGDIHILLGTHALFQKDVEFHDLRLAIVDEQHRFGVRERLALGGKGAATDMLVMTATPIPRSLALATYGDMDVSILDEKPPGRQPITTATIPTDRTAEVIDRLRAAIGEGRQCYWVCPLVEESERVNLTAAEERFKRLRAALGEDVVGLVHGQMPPQEKDRAMADFVAGRTRVLVATTVIEVGVNVPAATIMVIERAESFGLAQLHQLRGRVGRGSEKSTCILLYDAPLTEGGRRRLQVMRETEDGFRIAEEDMALRGAGDLIGTAQSGLPRFQVADLESQAGLMAMAQADARKLLADDPTLTSDRGHAARVLLWLMRRDESIRLISVG